jgi:hypothetical protein
MAGNRKGLQRAAYNGTVGFPVDFRRQGRAKIVQVGLGKQLAGLSASHYLTSRCKSVAQATFGKYRHEHIRDNVSELASRGRSISKPMPHGSDTILLDYNREYPC